MVGLAGLTGLAELAGLAGLGECWMGSFWVPKPLIWEAWGLHLGTLGGHLGDPDGARGHPTGHMGVHIWIFIDF